MGNPLSPMLTNIFMCKLENDILPVHKPKFYDRYVDDAFSKPFKNERNGLLETFNAYHSNV